MDHKQIQNLNEGPKLENPQARLNVVLWVILLASIILETD